MNNFKKIAISGKGGVGKTTFASVLTYLLADEGKDVYAIDVDPNPTLAEALGIPAEIIKTITPIIEMQELIAERTGSRPGDFGSFFKLNPKVDDIAKKFSVSFRGIHFLMMGVTKGAGQGCACPENAMVKSLMSHLMIKEKQTVVMDMVAGTEHMGRGTAKAVDAMIVVVEPGTRSINAAKQFARMASDLNIKKVYFVANKIRNATDEAFIKSEMNEYPIAGFLPLSDKVIEGERKRDAIFDVDSEFNQCVMNILKTMRSS